MSSKIAQSPARLRSVQQGMMDFPDALRAVIAGKRISKAEWDNLKIYGELRKNVLMIHLEDGWHKWIVSEGDLTGSDWFVI